MAKLSEMVEIANPKQPHCATVLLLDVSGSMEGSKLQQLNDGLRIFKEDICGTDDHPGDELAKKRVDLAIVTFSSDVQVIQDFTNMDAFEPPTLQAGGTTAMGEGIRKAIELIERRKGEYKAQGTDYYRPWILLITDGSLPTSNRVTQIGMPLFNKSVTEKPQRNLCSSLSASNLQTWIF